MTHLHYSIVLTLHIGDNLSDFARTFAGYFQWPNYLSNYIMNFTLYLFVSQYVGHWTMEFSDRAYSDFGEFRFPLDFALNLLVAMMTDLFSPADRHC